MKYSQALEEIELLLQATRQQADISSPSFDLGVVMSELASAMTSHPELALEIQSLRRRRELTPANGIKQMETDCV